MRALPNLVTGLRLALALALFLALAWAAGAVPGARVAEAGRDALKLFALVAFVVAALTDFVDGWLARRLGAASVWGSILDPIADKVLVCAAVLGLMTLHARAVALPGALILFREFAVSALREGAAAQNVRLPVTLLAKWKTTLQLIGLGGQLIVAAWSPLGLPVSLCRGATLAADAILWLAATVTVITGLQYAAQARRQLGARN